MAVTHAHSRLSISGWVGFPRTVAVRACMLAALFAGAPRPRLVNLFRRATDPSRVGRRASGASSSDG
jgi:hypothetical protein